MRRYGSLDPWLTRSDTLPEGTLVDGERLVPASELRASEFYRGWIQPQGLDLETVLVGVLNRGDLCAGTTIRIFGRVGTSSWSARGIAAAQVVTAQMSRVLRARLEVRQLEEDRDAMAGALDVISQPVVVVDAGARVIGLNASARRFLAPQQCADCPGCLLYTSQRAASVAVQRAVTAFATADGAPPPASGNGVVTVACPNGRTGISLSVGFLGRDPSAQGKAVAAVVLGASREELRKGEAPLWRLTPAEARLARRLAEGRSLKEAAAEFGVSINTVRMQLRNVFAKTGTRRQADLVRLMFGG